MADVEDVKKKKKAHRICKKKVVDIRVNNELIEMVKTKTESSTAWLAVVTQTKYKTKTGELLRGFPMVNQTEFDLIISLKLHFT